MASGIRAELRVDAGGSCPVVEAARAAGSPTFSISRAVDPSGTGRVTAEFMIDGAAGEKLDDEDVDAVFRYGSKTVYRLTHGHDEDCPCERIERFDCPIVDAHTRDGLLYLVFHAADIEQLQDIIATLRAEYPRVDIRRLLRSDGEDGSNDLVFVDRGQLTARQREVLETAHRMGYFERPKGANAGDVADALDISRSTFTEHLAAAQTKLLDAILED
jgi:predicted DNA binding protein